MSKYLLWGAIVLSWIVGNTFKIVLWSPGVRVSMLDLVVIVFTLGWLIKSRRGLVAGLWRFKSQLQPVFVFAGIALASLAIMGHRFGIEGLATGFGYLIRWVLYSGFCVVLIQIFKPQEIIKLLWSLGVVTVVTSLLQYFFFPDVRFLAGSGWDDHYYRVVSTFLDPGFTGLILVFILVLIMLQPQKNKWVNFVAWGLTYLALVLTYSRSSFLAYIAGMTWIAWKKSSWKLLVGTLLLLGATLPLLPRVSDGEGVKLERTSSIQARLENWRRASKIWLDHPILGVGFNVYRYAQRNYGYLSLEDWQTTHAGAGADASLLFVGATTGLMGLATYLWYLKRLSQVPGVLFFLLPLLAHAWFLNSLFYPPVLLWLSLATAYGLQSVPSEFGSQPGRKR